MEHKAKYFKTPKYRLLIRYPDGTSWDVPAFTPGWDNHFWGSEEEWDAIPDGTEIFPPEREPQITNQSARIEIMDFGIKSDYMDNSFIETREKAIKLCMDNGIDFNHLKTLEEMTELSKEILNYFTKPEKADSENLLEEVADVVICLYVLVRLLDTEITKTKWHSILNGKFKKIISIYGK